VVRQPDHRPLPQHLVDGTLDFLASLLVDDGKDFREEPSACFLLSPSGQALGHGIHEDDAPIGIGGDDGVTDASQRRFQRALQTLGRRARQAFRFEPLGAAQRLRAMMTERLHEFAFFDREDALRVKAHSEKSEGSPLGDERDAPERVSSRTLCLLRGERGIKRDVVGFRFGPQYLAAGEGGGNGVAGFGTDAADLIHDRSAYAAIADQRQHPRCFIVRIERAGIGLRRLHAALQHDFDDLGTR